MESNNQQSFWQFSDELRLQTSSLANLSINENIWGHSFTAKKPEDRKNFDSRVGGERSSATKSYRSNVNQYGSDQNHKINGFNNGWKFGSGLGGEVGRVQQHQKNMNIDVNGVFYKGVYSKFGDDDNNNNNNMNIDVNGVFYKGVYSKFGDNNNNNSNYNIKVEKNHEGKVGKKSNNNNSNNSKNSTDKRFKTLPPSEAIPRNEAIGGYIFVCNNDTMEENLKRQLFGLPPRYRDSVRAITPGLPLFLYNYSTHQLHGIFEASSFGGTNIDPIAWEDKKSPGESRFPAQVRVLLRKLCEPLEEDSFRPILHHYDGPKFRLELNIPEALALLDIFAESKP